VDGDELDGAADIGRGRVHGESAVGEVVDDREGGQQRAAGALASESAQRVGCRGLRLDTQVGDMRGDVAVENLAMHAADLGDKPAILGLPAGGR
jgi:hypothetical protein